MRVGNVPFCSPLLSVKTRNGDLSPNEKARVADFFILTTLTLALCNAGDFL